MKHIRAYLLLSVVILSLVPIASAGFLDDIKISCDKILFTIVSDDSEMAYLSYGSYEGTVIDPELMCDEELQYPSDYGTFSAYAYGKVTLSNSDDPFSYVYQADGMLEFYMLVEDVNNTGTTIQYNILTDDGTVETHSYALNTSGAVYGKWFTCDHVPDYYDTNEDGIITVEVIHPDTADELRLYYTSFYFTRNDSIAAPSEVAEITYGGGSSSVSIDSTQSADDASESVNDENSTTLANILLGTTGPVYTIPGFDSVFAFIGLSLVVYMMRRNKE